MSEADNGAATPADSAENHAAADPEAQAADTAADAFDAENMPAEDTGAEDHTEAPSASREAAKYRRRLRETEAERDQIADRLAAMQRKAAEQIAATHLVDGADLWRDGASVQQVLGDDGVVDPAKVAELAAATAQKHPHWKPTPRQPIRRGNLASGASSAEPAPTSWAKVLRDSHG